MGRPGVRCGLLAAAFLICFLHRGLRSSINTRRSFKSLSSVGRVGFDSFCARGVKHSRAVRQEHRLGMPRSVITSQRRASAAAVVSGYDIRPGARKARKGGKLPCLNSWAWGPWALRCCCQPSYGVGTPSAGAPWSCRHDIARLRACSGSCCTCGLAAASVKRMAELAPAQEPGHRGPINDHLPTSHRPQVRQCTRPSFTQRPH